MDFTRREFAKLALAAPAVTLIESPFAGSAFAQGRGQGAPAEPVRPNSTINGVRVGAITYSFRSMPESTAEATLDYAVRAGVSHLEVMGNVVDSWAGLSGGGRGGGGFGGRGRGAGAAEMTPEEQAAQQAAREAAAAEQRERRLAVPMSRFAEMRRMYDDAGVRIYAVKSLSAGMSDEEMDWVFQAGKTLGADHLTLELTDDEAALKRMGDAALRNGMFVGYHTHTQGSMTVFDTAFAVSAGNKANIDFGHYVAGGAGNPVEFLEKFHDRIASFHLKDRTTPENGAQNLPWGTGDTPIAELLRTVQRNGWDIPATVELEYRVPQWSDAVQEVAKCVAYCRGALA